MNNTWRRIAACVFFYIASSASAASAQEADFVCVALEQLRDRMEQDDKGTLDEFVAEVSTASRLSAAASRDSLVSLLRVLKTHCKKSTALGEQIFALHGEHFAERAAKAYLVRVVDMAGDLLKKEENVGLEPLIAEAAGKSKLLKFQAVDYTRALLVSFVGSSVEIDPPEEDMVSVPTGFKVLVRTRNSQGLSDKVDQLLEGYRGSNTTTFFRIFNISPLPTVKAKRKIVALHESIRPALLDELKRFRRVRWTTAPSTEDIRYTLDYIVNWYMIGFYRSNVVGFYSFNAERQRLSSQVQLVVQDALKDEAVLDKTLIIHQNFMRNFEPDDEAILDAFYQEAAHTVAQEVSPLFD